MGKIPKKNYEHLPEEEDDYMCLHHQLGGLLVRTIVGDQTVEGEWIIRPPNGFSKTQPFLPPTIFLPVLPVISWRSKFGLYLTLEKVKILHL